MKNTISLLAILAFTASLASTSLANDSTREKRTVLSDEDIAQMEWTIEATYHCILYTNFEATDRLARDYQKMLESTQAMALLEEEERATAFPGHMVELRALVGVTYSRQVNVPLLYRASWSTEEAFDYAQVTAALSHASETLLTESVTASSHLLVNTRRIAQGVHRDIAVAPLGQFCSYH